MMVFFWTIVPCWFETESADALPRMVSALEREGAPIMKGCGAITG